MLRKSWLVLALLTSVTCFVPRPAHAQFAVIDVAAIGHLIEQYNTLREQLTTALDHLDQARQEYAALTGPRGMEHLLEGIGRNYLPGDWDTFTAILNGDTGAYADFSAELHGLVDTHAILTPEELGRFNEADRTHLANTRNSSALLQALSHDALNISSHRFDALQQLIDAIPTAEDPKAILDLQARIGSEQAMLQNENSKLQVLYQAVQAEQWSQRQQRNEQAIRDLGSLRDLPPLDLPVAP